MITAIMCIVAVLLGLKIVWNILTPFELFRRALSSSPDAKPSGISMAPFVEIILLLVLIIFSALSSGSAWYNRPLKIALWGIVAIVSSYILLVILTYVLAWFATQFKKRQPK